MRILDRLKIPYQTHRYSHIAALSALEVANVLHRNPAHIYKTLVTNGKSGCCYVFLIPGNRELDLKKAASVTHEKTISMLPSKDLEPLTGYVHGGCSPIGMKKALPTFIDHSVLDIFSFLISAGKVGLQIEITLDVLQNALPIAVVNIAI